MARRPDPAAPSTRHPSQLLALAIGAVYTLVGVLGFLVRSSPIASFAVHVRPRRRHQDRHRGPNRLSSPGGVRVGFCLVTAPP
jgi:uncharacterized membrane protein